MSQSLLTESSEKTKQRIDRREARPKSKRQFHSGTNPILQLQRALGNQRIAQLIRAKRLTPDGKIIGLQPKLTVGAADDEYEQEADRVARHVVSIPDSVALAPLQQPRVEGEAGPTSAHVLQSKPLPLAASITPFVQRQTTIEEEKGEDKDRKEEQLLQAKFFDKSVPLLLQRELSSEKEEHEPTQGKSAGSFSGSFEAGADLESRVSQSKGGGSPLPRPVRAYMEPRFGMDFSHVRVHTGSDAVQMNRQVGAQAFTHDSDIYYGIGSSPTDLELTAHELTHVVQQTGSSPLRTSKTDEASSMNRDPSLQRAGAARAEPLVEKTSGYQLMRSLALDSTVEICRRVLTSRNIKVSEGGLRVVLLLNELDMGIPNCRNHTFWITLTKYRDWWPDDEIATCEAETGRTRSFSFGKISSGTYYLTIHRVFDHPDCCLKGDILVFDEYISGDSSGCVRDKDPSAMDIVHGALDIAGFIPVLGAVPDGINAAIYAAEGDWTNAGLSAVAMVPGWGDGVKLGVVAGKSAIKVTEKAAIQLGEEGIAKGLKEVKAASKAEDAAKAAKAEKEAAEQAEKEAAERAEKEAAEKKGKKKTCATEYPGMINCADLPTDYTFLSPQLALAALKELTGKKNLKLHSPQVAKRGPCRGLGMHYNVRSGSEKIASIGCCPCCKDSPLGPVPITLCRIIW